jgi:hypothetical protein
MIVLSLPLLIGTMAALAATAVAAPQVIGGSNYHTAAFEVKIPVLQR